MPYDIILADPPWHFRNYSADAPGMIHDRGRGANKYYPTMTTDQICQLSVPAADNAVLFLWSCWPTLPDALRVIEAWGFVYKTLAWTWVKSNPTGWGFWKGMGYYTRANTEPCLLATRGNVKKPANRSVSALIYAPVRAHSRKPDDQYEKIASLYPAGDRLELFARRPFPGWDSVGNEINGCSIEEALNENASIAR